MVIGYEENGSNEGGKSLIQLFISFYALADRGSFSSAATLRTLAALALGRVALIVVHDGMLKAQIVSMKMTA